MRYALLMHAAPDGEEVLSDVEREAAYAECLTPADDTRCVAAVRSQPVETAMGVRVAAGAGHRSRTARSPTPDRYSVASVRSRRLI
ncbi:hypothetical protein ABT025_35050 [Streptomyces sp. NPDC002809]|uniref:hypothetical protein n=1 Tax=Streptomyces sp. NPDC002809 TaxID=3154433 RepID=UPI003329F962